MTMKLTTTEFSFNASLSCIDLGHIAESMEEINQSRIKSLHYDMVDGQFNECFIFGDLMLKVFRSYTKLPITVHLACRNPIPYIKPCIANGADYIAIHYEADIDKMCIRDRYSSVHCTYAYIFYIADRMRQ